MMRTNYGSTIYEQNKPISTISKGYGFTTRSTLFFI